MSIKEAFVGLLYILVGLMFVFWWPIATIWCINTLFNTGIPTNVNTWLAVVMLTAFARIVFQIKTDSKK